MKPTILLLALSFLCPLLHADDSLKRLKAEYDRRKSAAVKTVDDWYATELAKIRSAADALGGDRAKGDAALQAAWATRLGGKTWLWAAKERPTITSPMTFNADGSGSHRHFKFRWEALNDTTVILYKMEGDKPGPQASYKLNASGDSLAGRDLVGNKVDVVIRLDSK